MNTETSLLRVAEGVYLHGDTCNVYVLVRDNSALIVDFGDGEVLGSLSSVGVTEVVGVCVTHHHRDQTAGLRRAVDAGIPVYVPHYEREYFTRAERFWESREVRDNYNTRQDRFTSFESIEITGTLRDYEPVRLGSFDFVVVPTPGHTPGSVSLRFRADGDNLLFCGDLLAGSGRLHSLAATQWTYNGGEGLPATELAVLDLIDDPPGMILPSHGAPFGGDIADGLRLLSDRLLGLMKLRRQNPRLLQFRDEPYEEVVPGLLRNRTSTATGYVLLSASGEALLLDFGYDLMTGFPAGSGPDSRRPSLASIRALRERGVTKIAAVLLTHYHDDHVAGCNVLRSVEGSEVWAPEFFADVLEHPSRYDLPCLWYEPVPVDRRISLESPLRWQEYEFTLHHQPGHTDLAVAIAFEVGGTRILAIGDQWQGGDSDLPNYVYENIFAADDYLSTARLYRELDPEILISGHWEPYRVQPGYFDRIEQTGSELLRYHEDLLGLEAGDRPRSVSGRRATIEPYLIEATSSCTRHLTLKLDNPDSNDVTVEATAVIPTGWEMSPRSVTEHVRSGETVFAEFELHVVPSVGNPRESGYRLPIGFAITSNGIPVGILAEALVEVQENHDPRGSNK